MILKNYFPDLDPVPSQCPTTDLRPAKILKQNISFTSLLNRECRPVFNYLLRKYIFKRGRPI
jgi:hypothetical protein